MPLHKITMRCPIAQSAICISQVNHHIRVIEFLDFVASLSLSTAYAGSPDFAWVTVGKSDRIQYSNAFCLT